MKYIYHILIVFFVTSTALAQAHDEYKFLDINNMKVPLFSRGDIFKPGLLGSHVAEIPTGSTNKVMFSQDMWFGGRDQHNELRISSQMFTENLLGNLEYAIGPVSTSPVHEFESKYNHVWKVSKTEIEDHIEYYNDPNYSMPNDILNWPAHGDTEYGEATHLAPFVDVNSNGIYEPELGEYPKIRGDQALFAMFNDVNYDDSNSIGKRAYIEVHVMLYGYQDTYIDYLENSFFVHYDIYNRSSNITYNDFYIAHHLNFNLGWFNDDFIGTHVTKNIAYVYNGDAFDESDLVYGSSGYGYKPPAYGWALLNQDFTATRLINYNRNPKKGFPKTLLARFNVMKGLFNDGTPFYHNNNWSSGEDITTFMYPGTTHPQLPNNWTEETTGNTPSSRQMVASTVSHNFGPGNKICLDYVGVFSRDYVSTQTQLNYLFDDVDGVKSIYNYENFDCSDLVLHIEESKPELLDFFVSDNQLTVIQQNHFNRPLNLHIVNTLGQHIMHETFNTDDYQKQIDITHLPSGVYFIPDFDFKFIK